MHTCEENTECTEPTQYLAGLSGVGPKTAERLVDSLGPDMADISKALTGPQEEVVKRLVSLKMPGIGRAGVLKIKKAWDERQCKWLVLTLLHLCVPDVPRW